jgi:hypothetical protein
MTSPQRSRARISWELALAQRSASTGGEVPVAPEQQETRCGRQCPPRHRATDHPRGGIFAQRTGVRKGEDA